MKRIAWFLVLALVPLAARGETVTLCNAATTAGVCTNTGVTDTNGWVDTAAYGTIIMSIKSTGPTTSTAVIEFLPCIGCDAVRFPKSGDQPITNIGSDPNAKTRSFKLPGHIPRVRWNLLTNSGNPAVTAYLTFEN